MPHESKFLLRKCLGYDLGGLVPSQEVFGSIRVVYYVMYIYIYTARTGVLPGEVRFECAGPVRKKSGCRPSPQMADENFPHHFPSSTKKTYKKNRKKNLNLPSRNRKETLNETLNETQMIYIYIYLSTYRYNCLMYPQAGAALPAWVCIYIYRID